VINYGYVSQHVKTVNVKENQNEKQLVLHDYYKYDFQRTPQVPVTVAEQSKA
jgi:hypothetical protein